MELNKRPCRACEGSGCKFPRCQGRRGALPLNAHSVECIACPVCLGSGQVEAKPGVRDALADAETLRAVLHSMWDGYSGYGGHTLLDLARTEGEMTIGWLAIPNAVGDGAEYHSEEAARAAFRAVPGLRGEA